VAELGQEAYATRTSVITNYVARVRIQRRWARRSSSNPPPDATFTSLFATRALQETEPIQTGPIKFSSRERSENDCYSTYGADSRGTYVHTPQISAAFHLLLGDTYCGSSGVARGMKMISCRTQYKSYTDENTHIHVLYPDRLPYAPLPKSICAPPTCPSRMEFVGALHGEGGAWWMLWPCHGCV
jgi:hypothetical protein